MAVNNNQMFYLGNFADFDTEESNYDVEDASPAIGVYDQPDLVAVNVHDGDNDGVLYDDEMGSNPGDFFEYNLGGGSVLADVDSTIVFNVIVTLGDGSTIATNATVVQLDNGDLFVTDYANNGSLDNLTIQSIELTSTYNGYYVGLYADSSVDNTSVVCFATGTQILTRTGERAVESLKAGEEVGTLDAGWQPIQWIGARRARQHPSDAPIAINPGSLGEGRPHRRCLVSPNHRILVQSPIAKRMFDSSEVFVRAKALLADPKIAQYMTPERPFRYWHIALSDHHVIVADGVPAESLYPGPVALGALSPAQKASLCRAFGSLEAWSKHTRLARQTLRMARQVSLVRRAAKNRKPLWSSAPRLPSARSATAPAADVSQPPSGTSLHPPGSSGSRQVRRG